MKVSTSWKDGTLGITGSGFTVQPSNVSFEVVSPSGSVEWVQAYRQGDGTWTASFEGSGRVRRVPAASLGVVWPLHIALGSDGMDVQLSYCTRFRFV